MEPTRQGSTTGGTAVGSSYSGGTAPRTASAPGSTMSGSATSASASGDTDFKRMDTNSDGWVSREEYLGFYGTRYDKMKRNDRGWVSWQDMDSSDGRFFQPGTTSNTTGNPVTSQPAQRVGSAIRRQRAAAPSNAGLARNDRAQARFFTGPESVLRTTPDGVTSLRCRPMPKHFSAARNFLSTSVQTSVTPR